MTTETPAVQLTKTIKGKKEAGELAAGSKSLQGHLGHQVKWVNGALFKVYIYLDRNAFHRPALDGLLKDGWEMTDMVWAGSLPDLGKNPPPLERKKGAESTASAQKVTTTPAVTIKYRSAAVIEADSLNPYIAADLLAFEMANLSGNKLYRRNQFFLGDAVSQKARLAVEEVFKGLPQEVSLFVLHW